MVAYLFEGSPSSAAAAAAAPVREIECHDESAAYRRAVSLGLGRVLHYVAPTDRRPAYVAYLTAAAAGPVLTFCRSSGTLPDPVAAAREAERWVRAHAADAYPVLTQRTLPSTPNGGSRNTADQIRDWVDGRLDALTVHYVRSSIRAGAET